ncbi:MAG: NAD-dependent epimerase/dehydratase family protein [Prevotellaceae bacterium]|nr:NAD-dependent epimerase/dehydratase family protein [Prevotellaceae bacterium]
MKILVTGAAGFIGAATVKALLERNHEVIGLDNINSYYDTALKYARLADAGIMQSEIREGAFAVSKTFPRYRFTLMNLTDRIGMNRLFDAEWFDIVINLAGQAGVRYSIENPFAYIESNVTGFLNILENCRNHPVQHLIYASSSSVYGTNDHFPYIESDFTDGPLSLYAATKKSDELMAYSYSSLFHIPATGLRFFTVYGPWGRPDMAPYIFLDAITKGKPITVFNKGDMQRDFTYIDDITKGIMLVIDKPPVATNNHPLDNGKSTEQTGENHRMPSVPHAVYNIGHSSPVSLLDFIHAIEDVAGRKAIMKLEDMQQGDVYCTYADTERMSTDFGYRSTVSVNEGIRRFHEWYISYNK